MTRDELIELAALDVYGLLDEYETALYTRSFHNASAAVQDEILRRQAEIAADPSLLGEEEPPEDLRRRVLDSVAFAVEQENVRLAPIATIGRHRAAGEPASSPPMTTAALLNRMRLALFSGSGQFWRAAAFALCGAVVVMAYFWAETRREATRITELSIGEITSEQLEQLEQLVGPTLQDYLFDPAGRHVVLSADSAEEDARAFLLLDADREQGFLVADGLPVSVTGSSYVLEVTDVNGSRHKVKEFTSTGQLLGVQLSLGSIKLSAASVWSISSSTSDDMVLLISS
jgi:hypothetical protein